MPDLQPGQLRAKRWNRGAVGPRSAGFVYQGALYPGLWLFSPGDRDHVGHGPFDAESGITVRTTLIRDGEVVGTNEENDGGHFEIPAGPATYTIDTSATRAFRCSAYDS